MENRAQVIRKVCCGKAFAACMEPLCYTEEEWKANLTNYVNVGHKVSLEDPGSFRFEKCTCQRIDESVQLSLFPEKLEEANQTLQRVGTPQSKKCEFCGCYDGIHKSNCLFLRRLS
jgi:hypothetical protein